MKKKYYLTPDYRFYILSDSGVVVMSEGDVDGDIIGWDPEGEGF